MRLGLWLAGGEWRAHPWRVLAALLAIAIGVALGLVVHLINASAVSEFSRAVRATTGQADLEIRGPRAGFDDTLLERVAADPDVAVASPMLEVDALIADDHAKGEARSLKLIGIDVFRAARVTPELLGIPGNGEESLSMLADDAVFLSPAAQSWLGLAPGDRVTLQVGLEPLELRIAGGLPGARPTQRLGTLDLGTAQWRLARLGTLSRIAIRLRTGSNPAMVTQRLNAWLPAGVFVSQGDDGDIRASNLSRAYRVNLNVLALVALFTGVFLVFSTQTLAVARRRGEFALLRTLGWPASRVVRLVIAEGASMGAVGSMFGVGLGIGMAAIVMDRFGADLGGGYFQGLAPALSIDPLAVGAYLALGTLAAAIGSALPALEMARVAPAQALKSGAEGAQAGRRAAAWPGLVLLAAGGVLTQLPPLDGLPLAGYLAIVCWLVGGISLMPRLATLAFGALARRAAPQAAQHPLLFLALQRLAASPGQVGIALSGIVASFALMVSMAIMVGSFRDAVDRWLERVLAAPLYFRVPLGGSSGFVAPDTLAAMAALPSLERHEWMRIQQIDMDPRRPPVTLMARDLDKAQPGVRIPLTGPALTPSEVPAGHYPVWVSEAMVDLYGWSLGRREVLPLAGQAVPVIVAGVWRDFARQHGTVTMDRTDYRLLTGDAGITDGALWPSTGISPAMLMAEIQRSLPETRRLEFAEPGEIRAASLRIFDRSFAVTYLLELVAIAIGLVGIGASFSAQVLSRVREFGMLRHLGTSRRGLQQMLASEAAGLSVFGVAAGGVLGLAIALVLIHVVNPQSFHWYMTLSVPWRLLGSVTLLLVTASVATVLMATRQATGRGPLRAVREDW